MLRSLLVTTALLPATAFAADTGLSSDDPYASPPADLYFEGIGTVIDADYQLPIGVNLDVILTEIWLGVTPKLSGLAEFGLISEGTSDLSWSPDDGVEGLLYHDLVPTPNSGVAALDSSVGFVISFELYEGGYGSGRRLVSFDLFSQDIPFKLTGEPFTPFLLPTDSPNSSRLKSDSNVGAFEVPLTLPVNISVAELTVGVIVRGKPVTNATYGGKELNTKFQDVIVGRSGEIQMEEQLPSADLLTRYTAYVDANISYQFNVDLAFGLKIFGFGLFDIKIPLYGQSFPLFANLVDLDFNSENYAHPLPMIALPTDVVDMGNVEAGDAAEYTFRIQNDGELELTGLVGIAGNPAFSVTPADFSLKELGEGFVVITYAPTEPGPGAATLIIETNDPMRERIEVPITASGVAPAEEDSKGGNGDNGTGGRSVGSDLYATCGCSNSSPTGGWALVGLLPLLALRRRR